MAYKRRADAERRSRRGESSNVGLILNPTEPGEDALWKASPT
jgi:hypothetical protein